MNKVLLIALLAIFLAMAFSLVRALRGPTIYDRMLAVNLWGTKTVLGVALLVFVTGHHDLIDVALVYALINFVTMVAVLKLIKKGDLAAPGEKVTIDD